MHHANCEVTRAHAVMGNNTFHLGGAHLPPSLPPSRVSSRALLARAGQAESECAVLCVACMCLCMTNVLPLSCPSVPLPPSRPAPRRRSINMRLMRRLENPNAKYLSPFGKLSPTRPAAVAADSPSLALSLPQRSSSVSASRRARNDGFNLNILAVVPIAVAGAGAGVPSQWRWS